MPVRRIDILIKTKGGHKEGMGDVTSSLDIAKAFIESGRAKIAFLINDNENVMDMVSRNGYEYGVCEGIGQLKDAVSDRHFDIAILNQLDTPAEESALLKAHARTLVAVEDSGPGGAHADIRFNVLYPREGSVTDFAFIPLGDAFQKMHKIEKDIRADARKILITQGGSDTYGFTPKIVRGLYKIPSEVDISIVLGPSFSHDRELNEALRAAPRSFTIIKGRDDLSGIMSDSDIAISAGGNTLFELACLGVPAVVVCAELFEVKTAERLGNAGFGINLGFGEDVAEEDIYNTVRNLIADRDLRLKMSRTGHSLIDGSGSRRTVEMILEKFGSI